MATKSKRIKRKLIKKYRLVVLIEESFEEKFSFKLTLLNVFVFGGLFSLFLIFSVICLIVYTPLKEYIPGFESPELKKNAINLNFKLDSLEQNMHAIELYTESMKPVLLGDKSIEMDVLPFVTKDGESVYQLGIVNNDSIHQKIKNLYALLQEKNSTIEFLKEKYKGLSLAVGEDSIKDFFVEPDSLSQAQLESLETSVLDSIFREKVEREERFSLFGSDDNKSEVAFVTPVEGNVTEQYNTSEHHFAIDIAAKKGASVKSIADGVVVFAERSIATGFVIVIVHQDDYVSIYKHNSKINVIQGSLVKAGQVIANVGSSGELSTGPHLHFEMWKDSYPVDPTNFMKF
ncbi:MAG: M23 family metallopeptidase [Wenyingzhuangia sp.]|uniref:M23 family metallopeptidase n=1 Tax=Wenyingzhuangia sp. TaxID=1964193 RepID=UPI003219CCB6